MKKYLGVIFTVLTICSCKSYDDSNRYVDINTEFGDIVVKLYNETPKHTQNFVKLANEKFFDNIIFHRVIKDFMIQGGDPTTKNAVKGKEYGETDAGYLLNPEFNDTIIHKKGALAMAREGDDVNPEKKSSSSQFYIVVGKIFTQNELDEIEVKNNKKIVENYKKQLFNEMLQNADKIDNQEYLNSINNRIKVKVDSLMLNGKKFKFTDKQRETYTTIGGTPHLDGNYTVFGEVVKGLDIVEKISKLKTDQNDRPAKDVKMVIRVLN